MTTSETPSHKPGEQLGPYELERLLGRGAAAEVWQAIEKGDLGFRKRQALKLLRPPPGEMEAQKKSLVTEARVCGHLKHPGVVDVYRVGDHQGEIYVAMEFVDGPDLNTLLEGLRTQEIAIPVPVCIEMALEICEALEHAHTARADDGSDLKIIHRDLKPSNILVDRRGVLKISDWGLVKSSINLEATTRGVVKGTPGYIAPEVWGGTRDFQPSVDLFAVGAMLFEFVVGERLFQGCNLARTAELVARRKPEEEAARLEERAPTLVPVVARLLQRVPGKRYQSAEQVCEVLRELHAGHSNPRTTFKDFLRDVSHIVERLAPAVTGTGRPGAAPGVTSGTPVPNTPPPDLTPSVDRPVDQSEPTVGDEETPGDEEQPTDPNMAPAEAAASAAEDKPTFERPSTVIFSPDEETKRKLASSFGPDGVRGTEGVALPVPVTRAMASMDMSGVSPEDAPTIAARKPVKVSPPPQDVGATRVQAPQVPEETRETSSPERGIKPPAPARKKKRKKRRKKRRPADQPPAKKTSNRGMLVALIGVALLLIGLIVALTR